ncbi:MAG: 3-hydroxylacyl-ACP dehydratase [Proteobacteria bacterium]|nr:3-hydroxylacyl-ACP dehydratase [Pseudomonadota bacterium]MBS0494028.1 3-hydroxylacyl-ACP dehydratase [Pseudomonadota bacterium]
MLEPTLLPDHAWIAAHIPHQGSMCLLEGVLTWDAQHIVCQSNSHQSPDNPLRAEGRLGASNAVEYAAQAMAVHGVLLAGDAQPLGVGYLASIRSVRLHVDRLDDIAAPLHVEVTRLSGDDALILYQFSVSAAGQSLAEGRASVVLNADAELKLP